jgi:hypothetical protein
MNNYKLMNEYTRYKSRCAAIVPMSTLSTSNGVYVMEKTNTSISVRMGDRFVLTVKDANRVRVKHDSILICSRDRLFIFHGELQETYTCEIKSKHTFTLCDTDVYVDPFRQEVCPWYLFYDKSRGMMSLQRGDVVMDRWYHSGDYPRLNVIRQDCAIVSSHNNNRIYHESRQGVFEKDTSVIQTSYMYNINKYLIQTDDCFVLATDDELQYMVEHGVNYVVMCMSESHIFHTDGACKDIHFSRYHDVVVYNCNRARICVAETRYPFNINPNVEIPMHIDDKVCSIVINHTKYKNMVFMCTKAAYILSMFPISFTASTSIDTILE